MRVLAGALLAATMLSPARDIEVGIPPGTPLEWERDLFRPGTTPRRGRVPTPKPLVPDPTLPRPTVVQERVPEPLLSDFGSTSLYDYFRITTVDIMRHVVVMWPKKGEYDPDVPQVEPPDMVWKYPPTYPTELYWMGALNTMRGHLHPEVVSHRELACYIVGLGEPGLLGSRNVKYPVGDNVDGPSPLKNYPIFHLEVSDDRPPVAGGETPYEQMVHRMVVYELTNGFPYVFDPSYCRYTLSLGRDAVWAVIDASKSDHAFLARNATAVLGLMHFEEAQTRMREIVAREQDIIKWMRAVMSLARRRDAAIVGDLEKAALDSSDEIRSTAAMHALGLIGDRKAVTTLLKIASETEDIETLFTALPAIARLNDETSETRQALAKLVSKRTKAPKKTPAGGLVPPKPEPAGTKVKIVDGMLTLARVASGDSQLRTEMLDRFDRTRLTFVPPANWFLAIDVLAFCGDAGRPILRKIVEDRELDANLRAAALTRLRPVDVALAKKLALDEKLHVALRAVAMLALTELEEPVAAREVAQELLTEYVRREGTAPPVQAALAAMSMQILGSTGGAKLQLLCEAAEKALRDRAWAYRFTKNSNNITKAVIYSQPPTLEIAAVELGRALDPGVIPTLIKILRSRAGGGRAEAALALGALGGRDATEALVAGLTDPVNGWVRFNCYRALRALSGINHYDDWLFLPPPALRPHIERYQRWWKESQK